MNLSDLIQSQLKAIDAVARETQRTTRGEADLARPAAALDARIAHVDARIASLERQRADTDRRLGEAIAEQKALRDKLAAEAKSWRDRAPVKPIDPPRRRPVADNPTLGTAQPSPRPRTRATTMPSKPSKG